MKKFTFLAFLLIIFSCEKVDLRPEIESEEPPSAVNASVSSNTYTDITGRIEIWYGSSSVSTSGIPPGPNANKLTGTKYVPSGFVCIGGGSRPSNNSSDPGVLLTESRPLLGGSAFSGWRSSAKAHMGANNYTWYLYTYAIGIRLKDNNGNYIPASTLKNYLKIYAQTSSVSNRPYKKTNVGSDYHLISGGAKVNWSGAGNLLTESYPSGTGWIAKGKDHGGYVSPASITSFAIGIKKTIPNFGSLGVTSGSACSYTSGYAKTVSKSTNAYNTYLVTGIGGKATYNGYGRMLNTLQPSYTTSRVISKDHYGLDSGTTCAYYLAIKKN